MSAEREPAAAHDDAHSSKRVFVTLIVVLIIALAGLIVFLVFALQPLGAPHQRTASDGMTWVSSIYGWGNEADELLVRPTDVAVAPDGTMWVTDLERAQVLGFTPFGTLTGVIRSVEASPGVGYMDRPEGVGVDGDGNVYVADSGANKVLRFTENGEFVREWEVPSPLDVAAREGEIAVSTIYGIAFFDEQGEFVRRTGMRGHGDDEFDVVHGIAFGADGTLYVADTQNSRVKAIAHSGETLWIAGASRAETAADPDDPEFSIPSGVAVDGMGRPVVVDPFGFELVVLDPDDGGVLDRYGTYGSVDGRFLYPTGVAYDAARDYFVVADTQNDRLQVVTLPGSGGGRIEALRRGLSGPVWLWAIPFVAVALAIAIRRWRRRRVRQAALGTQSEEDE